MVKTPLQKRASHHNALRGNARMIEVLLQKILASDTISPGAAEAVKAMQQHTTTLKNELKKRID